MEVLKHQYEKKIIYSDPFHAVPISKFLKALLSLRVEKKRYQNTVVSVGHLAEKFNDHGRKANRNFSVLNHKYPFFGKFDPKYQNYQFKLKFGI